MRLHRMLVRIKPRVCTAVYSHPHTQPKPWLMHMILGITYQSVEKTKQSRKHDMLADGCWTLPCCCIVAAGFTFSGHHGVLICCMKKQQVQSTHEWQLSCTSQHDFISSCLITTSSWIADTVPNTAEQRVLQILGHVAHVAVLLVSRTQGVSTVAVHRHVSL